MNIPEDIDLRLLRQLEREPRVNQRGLARRLSLSLGKVNYCVQALVDKGLIKISNFRRSDNKLAYAYLLTPAGLQEKSRLTVTFLKRKQLEYEQLQTEIAQLQREVEELGPALPVPVAPDSTKGNCADD
jgi:EPS-associated MarR family transcriptional regulator